MQLVKPWPPARFTAPLAEGFPSVFARFELVFDLAWDQAFGYELEVWQKELLKAVTELYPDGHAQAGRLRFRQVLVTLGRQNGKTEIAAALGLLVMIWKASPLVIGIATSVEQARIVYDRTMKVIQRNRSLASQFEALTGTRGLRANDGGKYEMKASKSAALQGLPIDLGVVDEVHLLKQDLWTDLVNGTGGRPDCVVVGVTTAGDEDSALLKHLYELGAEAISNRGTRFGFFCWESPDAFVPEDDGELGQLLMQANPALASGRIDLETVVGDVRTMPDADIVRYRLNRFVSSTSDFIGSALWLACGAPDDAPWPQGKPVFAIDRTPDWSHASIVAAVKDGDGTIWTSLVASIRDPDLSRLMEVCVKLRRHRPASFVMDAYQLKDLATEMKRRGMRPQTLNQADIINASSLLYSKVVKRSIQHDHQPLLALQMPRAVRKNVGDGFRISRKDSSIEIDAVMALTMAIYAAETHREVGAQIF